MESILTTSTTFIQFHKSNINPNFISPPFKTLQKPFSNPSFSSNFSCNFSSKSTKNPINENPFSETLKKTAGTAVLTVAAALMAAKFGEMPAKAETLAPIVDELEEKDEKVVENSELKTPLSKLIESDGEAVDNLRALLHRKLEDGDDEEGLKILEKLVEVQPSEIEWKFMLARLLNEMGKTAEARDVFEDILGANPLNFEALFENALLMDRCGEGEAVISRLETALSIANEESKAKEARDVRLIMAQIKFLQKNINEALSSYDELCREDPKDFRPYFCRGMIYSLLDRNAEAKEQFAKYKELSPKKLEVDGYLRSPLSRMKLF